MKKIFIDGQAGTTGLQIKERLLGRESIDLLEIQEAYRKDQEVKKQFLNEADLVILCLHDEAARDSVALIENENTRVLDASTAHRTNPNWVYGLPELNATQRAQIRKAKRVSNPGCYPTGFLLAVTPLVQSGFLPQDYPVTINAVSGYSGGGRQMIEQYEQKQLDSAWSHRTYGLLGTHKHVPEMTMYSGLAYAPIFAPAVANVAQGMLVNIPLNRRVLPKSSSAEKAHAILSERYHEEPFVQVHPVNDAEALENKFMSMVDCNGTNRVDLFVYEAEHQLFVIARLDNLGKGASGAAVQNLNLMLGFEESEGLI